MRSAGLRPAEPEGDDRVVKAPRSILITGASSGIGAALAREYAAPETRLALCGRNPERLAAAAALCRERGAQVVERCLDVADPVALGGWVEEIDRAAPLELVVANAGVQGGLWRAGAGETLDELNRVMAVNFGGVCNTVYAVLPSMRRRRSGQIAIVTSLAALRGIPFSPGYCASKAALNAYGEALAAWLAPEGIIVSIVMPGFVATRMSDTVAGPKPLMMSAEKAARIIRRGLISGNRRIVFPYRLYLGMRLLRTLPSAWVDSILRRIPIDIGPYR